MEEYVSQIEELIQYSKFDEAVFHIGQLSKDKKTLSDRSLKSKIVTSRLYRMSHRPDLALRCFKFGRVISSNSNLTPLDAEAISEFCLALASAGASAYPVSLLKSFSQIQIRSTSRLAILLNAGHEESAVSYAVQYLAKNSTLPAREKSVIQFILGFAHYDLENYNDSIVALEKALASGELNSIETERANLVLATSYAASKNRESCFATLDKISKNNHQGGTDAWFDIETAKVRCHFYLGDVLQAEKILDRLLQHPTLNSAEQFRKILIYYWKGEIDFSKNGVVPSEWLEIISNPLEWKYISRRILQKIPKKDFVIPVGKDKQVEKIISLNGDWVREKNDGGKEKYRLGVYQEERLAALLILAYPNPVSEWVLLEKMWPGDPFGIISHRRRLYNCKVRLKKTFGISIKTSKKAWSLAQLPDVGVRMFPWKELPPGDIFLDKHQSFRRTDVEEFFNVSKSSSVRLISNWLAGGYVRRKGSNYEVIQPIIK